MTVRVVPPGSLAPNPRNEHAALSPDQRRSEMLRVLVRGLASADRKPARTEPTMLPAVQPQEPGAA